MVLHVDPSGSDTYFPDNDGADGENLEDYLTRMRQISDVAYYNVVKENDFSGQSEKIQEGMNLLYEANRDNLRSIVIYNNYGSLLAAEPIVSQKEDPNVTKQEWFIQAMDEMENMHFLLLIFRTCLTMEPSGITG